MLFGFGCLSRPRIEISDISAIYRISAYSEAIFAAQNRLEEKSKKSGNVGDISQIYRYRTEISAKFR